MKGLPEFSDSDRRRLSALGVVDAQVAHLRHACVHVWLHTRKPAARNDVAELLDDVSELADKLLNKLAAIGSRVSAAHASAHTLIELEYWKVRPDDSGPTSFHCLAPRIEALRDAARQGKQELPSSPSRHRSASPYPVGKIAEALQTGWREAYGSSAHSVRYEGGREVYPKERMGKRYPRALIPSAADGSAFRAIVGICYEAMGGNPDPVAAIKNYLKAERASHAEPLAALEVGIAEANTRRHRTSPKE